MSDHDWQIDLDELINPRRPDSWAVERCTKCGCLRISQDVFSVLTPTKIVYKPAEFTFNPFKVLKSEPPCPATW